MLASSTLKYNNTSLLWPPRSKKPQQKTDYCSLKVKSYAGWIVAIFEVITYPTNYDIYIQHYFIVMLIVYLFLVMCN